MILLKKYQQLKQNKKYIFCTKQSTQKPSFPTIRDSGFNYCYLKSSPFVAMTQGNNGRSLCVCAGARLRRRYFCRRRSGRSVCPFHRCRRRRCRFRGPHGVAQMVGIVDFVVFEFVVGTVAVKHANKCKYAKKNCSKPEYTILILKTVL